MLKSSGFFATIVAIAGVGAFSVGCKLNKSDRGDGSGNSADAAAKPASYVSCHKDDGGAVQRCLQYDIANLNPIVAEAIKADCGRAEKGLDGYAYSSTSCPIDNQIGKCSANKPVLVYNDFYYSPAFTVDTATKACVDSEGAWTSF